MAEIRVEEAEGGLLEDALVKLGDSSINSSRKQKIENIMKNSQFGAVYCEYFLADDPIMFRTSLDQNVQFAIEAEEYGIGYQGMRENLPDDGVEIDFNQYGNFGMQKLVGYANLLLKSVKQGYEKMLEMECHINEGFMECIPPNIPKMSMNELIMGEVVSDEQIHKLLNSEIALPSNMLQGYRQAISDFVAGTGLVRGSDELDERKREITDKMFVPGVTAGEIRRLENERDALDNPVTDDDMQMRLEDELGKALYRKSVELLDENLAEALGNVKPLYDKIKNGEDVGIDDLDSLSDDPSPHKRSIEIKKQLLSASTRFDGIMDDFHNSFYGPVDGSQIHLFRHLELDLENIQDHLGNYKGVTVASNVKKKNAATYFVKVEDKLPDDVVFGNDGGCCIAVAENSLGNGDSVPYFLLDDATVLFGVYQKVGNRKAKRVGMVIAHATVDEHNDPTLLCNSYELSESQNPLSTDGLNVLVDHISCYLWDYCDKNGFEQLAVGNHEYNTAVNYMDPSLLIHPDYKTQGLLKLPDNVDTPKFYSEVLDDNCFSKPGDWAFI